MKSHPLPTEELRDLALSFQLGNLADAESGSYAAHLPDCGVCRQLEREAREAAFDLSLAAPAVAPPAPLRARLMETISLPVQGWQNWSNQGIVSPEGPISYAFAADAVWEPTGTPGIKARRLWVDEANDRVAMLVRMEPGASFPGHRHANPEDCFVIEGDLYAHDFSMKAGDYRRAHPGSVDPVQATRGGCLLFLVSSLRDELEVAPPA